MARGDQLGRQWKIIRTLLASKTGKSVKDIAADLECHPRTVYRDLEALQAGGFPVYTERSSTTSRWALLESARQQVPIPFSLTELMALYFSRTMLKVMKRTIFYDSLESLFQKIKATLSPEFLRYLGQIEGSLHVSFKPYKEYGAFKDIMDRAGEAILQRHPVRVTYYTMSRRKESERVIDPYKLWFFDGTFYLLAHCRLRRDIRLFAVDRIRKIEMLETQFEIADDFDVEALLHSSFGAFIGDVTPVAIRFSADIAGYVMERTWHGSQTIEKQADSSIIFRAAIAGTREIKHWVMSWGAGAEVLEPESLRKEIAAEAAAVLRNHEGGKIH